MPWTPVCLSPELPPQVVIPVTVGGRDLAVWRSAAGVPAIFDDRCPHRGMRLSHGFVRGEMLSCIYHGWRYDPAGQCRKIPAHPGLEPPEAIRVPVVRVAEADGVVWAGTAEGEAAAGADDRTAPRTTAGPAAPADARLSADNTPRPTAPAAPADARLPADGAARPAPGPTAPHAPADARLSPDTAAAAPTASPPALPAGLAPLRSLHVAADLSALGRVGLRGADLDGAPDLHVLTRPDPRGTMLHALVRAEATPDRRRAASRALEQLRTRAEEAAR